MGTVIDEYRNIVRRHRPNARCARIKDAEGSGFSYQIMDGAEPIGDVQAGIIMAWREAERILIDAQWAADHAARVQDGR